MQSTELAEGGPLTYIPRGLESGRDAAWQHAPLARNLPEGLLTKQSPILSRNLWGTQNDMF